MPHPIDKAKTYLAICAIVRDEALNIAEWIEFHRLVGVERFFVYDDGSIDDTIVVLQKINHGDIVIHPWGFGHDEYATQRRNGELWVCTYQKTPQITAFNHCSREHKEDTRWCAFIDVDEYLYHATQDDLKIAIQPFEDCAAVAVHWLTFGTNGHKTRPAGLTIENYTRRGPVGGVDQWGKHVKAIAQLDHIHSWGPHGSHSAEYSCGVCVDENRNLTHLGSMYDFPTTNDHWRLNHYFTRSEEEFLAKRTKEDHNAVPMRSPDTGALHDQNDIEDCDILRFLPQLKERLGC